MYYCINNQAEVARRISFLTNQHICLPFGAEPIRTRSDLRVLIGDWLSAKRQTNVLIGQKRNSPLLAKSLPPYKYYMLLLIVRTLPGHNFPILQYFSLKLCSYTNFGTLFPTVAIDFCFFACF